MNLIIKIDLHNTILIKNLGNLSLIVKSDLQNTIFEKNLQTFKLDHKMPSSKYNLNKKSKNFCTWSLILIFKIQYSWKIRKFLNLIIKSDLQDTIHKFFNLITLHSLTGKYRFFTGKYFHSYMLWLCTGFEGANFIEMQGNIWILYRDQYFTFTFIFMFLSLSNLALSFLFIFDYWKTWLKLVMLESL